MSSNNDKTLTIKKNGTRCGTFESPRFGVEVGVVIKEEAHEVDREREDDFGLGDWVDFSMFLADFVRTYVDDVKVVATKKRDMLELSFCVPDRDHAGLFYGSQMKHFNMLKQWVRAQQIYPHNRYVKYQVVKDDSNEDPDEHLDKNVNSSS